MSWKWGVAFVVVGGALVAVMVFPGQRWAEARHATPAPPRVVARDASWAKAYTSVEDLMKDSDVAVSGTFGKVVRQTGDPQHLMYRDYAFTVTRVLQAKDGIDVNVDQVITVHQTGGIADGVQQEIRDDPLFNQGEKAALFLVQDGPGAFHVAGGPGGRFKVDAGNNVFPFNDESAKFAGTTSDLATKLTAR
jgi:hypothetical protein